MSRRLGEELVDGGKIVEVMQVWEDGLDLVLADAEPGGEAVPEGLPARRRDEAVTANVEVVALEEGIWVLAEDLAAVDQCGNRSPMTSFSLT